MSNPQNLSAQWRKNKHKKVRSKELISLDEVGLIQKVKKLEDDLSRRRPITVTNM